MDVNNSSPSYEKDGPTELNTEKSNDSYAYLERNSFSSEKFKIEIRGLPKFYGVGVSTNYQVYM